MRTITVPILLVWLAAACGSVNAPADPDAAPSCPDSDPDGDGDTVCDSADVCAGFDDRADADSDAVPDGCDACAAGDDTVDADGDDVADACDGCPGSDDSIDADSDNVADDCDVCPLFDDTLDADSDGVPDGCEHCPGSNDAADADADTVPDGCDRCPGENDLGPDSDNDGVVDPCDQCPGFDDLLDINGNDAPDDCELVNISIPIKIVGTNRWHGWHADAVTHSHTSTNDNTYTGFIAPNDNLRSYYVFTLTGFTAFAIRSLTLRIQQTSYGPDASESMSVWDVSTAAATVEADGFSVPIYTDLGSGTQYGSFTATLATNGVLHSIPLNAAAAANATAALGADFVVGVRIDNLPGNVLFSGGGEAIEVRYLPP